MTRFSSSAAHRADKADDSQRLASWYTPGLSDGIGDRLLMFDNSTASSLELLRFRPEFGRAPGFEEALRERVEALAAFVHPRIAKVRAVELLGDDDGLALISNHVTGRRLSEILQNAHGPQFAIELVRQLLPVLAALEEQGGGIAHGLVTPERVIVTPEGELVLTEHVLAPALERLRLPASRLRSDLGLVLPPGATSVRLDDPRVDIVQLGYLALSLLAGQRLRPLDSPREIFGLIDRQSISSGGQAPSHLQDWLVRALQVDRSAFASAGDAHRALRDWPDRELDAPPPAPETRALDAPAPAIHVVSSAEPADFLPEMPEVLMASSSPARRPIAPEPEPAAPQSIRLAADVRPAFGGPVDDATLPAPGQPPRPDRPNPASTQALRWVAAALALLAMAEAVIIAGLLASRTPAGPGNSTDAASQTLQLAGVSPGLAAPGPTPAAPAPTARTEPAAVGRLEVTTDPPGARVSIGDRALGVTPLSATLTPGQHTVVIASANGTTRRTVTVTAGGTATLMASLAPAGATGGWLTIESPVDLQVYEDTTLLGTSRAERLMLPAGRHQLRLVAAALNFETPVTVDVQAGRTVTTRVAVPNGTISLNALPWANVWVDGQAHGTTPIANMAIPIGSHEVIWRHPQLGERRQTIVVTAKSPVRLVVDMRQ
jgi:hypothetical protein